MDDAPPRAGTAEPSGEAGGEPGGEPTGEPTGERTSELTEAELDFLRSVFALVRDGATATVANFLDQGLPVNLTNGKGDTLLILAAYHKHGDLVRALLERGADTARVNDRGQTALGAAVFRDAADIVGDLLAAGADPGLGEPNALAVAEFFTLERMSALLAASR